MAMGSVLVVVGKWMGGQESCSRVVVAGSSSMPQPQHDPRPVVVDVKTGLFGA